MKIVLPRCDQVLKRRFFHVRVIQRWNALPEHIVMQTSLATFKRKLEVEFGSILKNNCVVLYYPLPGV